MPSYYESSAAATTLVSEVFTATPGQTVFTLSAPAASIQVVTVGGGENRYVVTGAVSHSAGSATVTLTSAVTAGLEVVVTYVPA